FAIDPASSLLRRRTQIRYCGSGPDVDIAATLGFWFGIHEPIDDMRYLAGASTYLCQMFWSGNWAMQVMPNVDGAVVSGGLNNWRFRCGLGPTDSLPLPTVLFGRFDGDLNAATQRLHDYRRAQRPDADRPIPVQFNSWYPYLGEPTAEAMLPLVPVAKRLGCEAFVIDSGWFQTDEGESK